MHIRLRERRLWPRALPLHHVQHEAPFQKPFENHKNQQPASIETRSMFPIANRTGGASEPKTFNNRRGKCSSLLVMATTPNSASSDDRRSASIKESDSRS